jgi:alpha-beta hydrolase superfamily lysophospholipase
MPTIQAFDGVSLEAQFTAPAAESNPCLLWLHGAFEHCGHYEDARRYFTNLGWGNLFFDLRGHGKSGGKRIFLADFEHYLQDINSIYNAFRMQIKGPLILVGHSMGGLVAIRYLQWSKAAAPLRHCIVTAPFLGIAVEIPAWKSFLSKLIVGWLPGLSMPNGLEAKWLSHNPEYVRRYETDPLVFKNATAGWFEQMLKNHQLAFQEIPNIRTALDIFIAEEDKIVSNNAIELFFERLPEELPKSKNVLPGFFHEVFNEKEKELIFSMVESKIKERL